MHSKLVGLVALCLAIPALSAGPSADPSTGPQPATPTSAAPPLTEEQVIANFKADMFAKRADIIAKSLTLTAEQAARFWPLFDQYLKEQEPNINAQIEATRAYAAEYEGLSAEAALACVNALLKRDQQIHDLRAKWLKKFQPVMPATTAARAIHLDRRLSNLTQVQLSAQIPLVK